MWAGSAAPSLIAACAAAATASTRTSALAPLGTVGTINCQPSSCVHLRHCGASAGSTSAIAGLGGCAAALHASRLMAQTAADFLDQLLNVVGLLQGGDGKNECIVLLQVLLQLLR